MRRGTARAASGVAAVILVGASLVLSAQAPPIAKPDTNAITEAVRLLNAAQLRTIRYSGSGAIYLADVHADAANAWSRVPLTSYDVAIDYPATGMQVDRVREPSASSLEGRPTAAALEPRQTGLVSGNVSWDVLMAPAKAVRLNADALLERRLAIWTTPHGFLKAALANQPALQAAGSGTEVSFYVGRQRVVGFINSRHEVERVRTWVTDPLAGETVIDTTYTRYAPFGVTQFPTRILQRRGIQPVLDLLVTSVQPNAPVRIVVPGELVPVH